MGYCYYPTYFIILYLGKDLNDYCYFGNDVSIDFYSYCYRFLEVKS